MSMLSWPKTIVVLTLLLLLAAVAGIYALGRSTHAPEQVTVNRQLALPGGAGTSGNTPPAVTLPDIPAPPPLPGAAQTP